MVEGWRGEEAEGGEEEGGGRPVCAEGEPVCEHIYVQSLPPSLPPPYLEVVEALAC